MTSRIAIPITGPFVEATFGGTFDGKIIARDQLFSDVYRDEKSCDSWPRRECRFL